MMRFFLNKLKSRAGETLVESLASILIFTMASIVMFSMVSSANDINLKTQVMDAKNQADMIAVEKGESAYENGTGTVTFSLGSTPIASANVTVYGGQNGTLYTYFMTTAGG